MARAVFAERGYAQTSLADIARAAGISRTSLFSYVPSKAQLVWAPYDEAGDRFSHAIATAITEAPLAGGIRHAFRATLALTPDAEQEYRDMWLLISENPELLSGVGARQERGMKDLARAISRHLGVGPDDFLPAVAGSAIAAAATAASRTWALGRVHTSLADTVDRAIEPLLGCYGLDNMDSDKKRKAWTP